MSGEHPSQKDKPHVVIIGGGFAGLACALKLRRAPVRVTLIDRQNYHLFQPLLYQVATGGLSPANIATPLRKIVGRCSNVQVLLGEVTAIDVARRAVAVAGHEIGYDYLVVAAGAENAYFGHDEWERHAPGLKSIEDATAIRGKILRAFERAEFVSDPDEIRHLLTFVIIGAGPTGVELAGAISEIARHTLRHEFRTINPEDARIILVDHSDRVLPPYPEGLSEAARTMLTELNVEVRNGLRVTDISAGSVTVTWDGGEERIAAATVLWAAGVGASPLGERLADSAGLDLEKGGQVPVGDDLSIDGYPEVFVVGDMASARDESGAPLPGVAPVAAQQGTYVAGCIRDYLAGRQTMPFRYLDAGMASTIGRGKAVARIFGLPLKGAIAWLAWLFIHLMKLVSFENRLLVLIQWAWNYTTWNRGARLITGRHDDRDSGRA